MEDRQALRAQIAALETELAALREEQRLFLLDRAMIAALSDQDNEKFDAETLRDLSGQPFRGVRFALCAFTDNFSSPGALDERPVWESLNSTFYVTLSKLIRPRFRSQQACITANRNGMVYCLVDLADSLPENAFRDTFTGICRDINDAAAAQEGFRFQIFVSPIGCGMESLPGLRRDVEALEDYRKLIGGGLPEILFYEDIFSSGITQQRTADEDSVNGRFSSYINRGEFERAKAFFHETILSSLRTAPASVTMLRLRIAGLLDYMLQTLTRAGESLGLEQALEETGAAELLLSAENLDEISVQMDTILDAMARQWSGSDPGSRYLARKARAFIDEQYVDRELNVNSVADHLGLSPAYLTRVFQGCYQMSVLKYIQLVRLAAAKRLLRSGMPPKEVAEAAGYGAQVNMLRAFKRMEGRTPGEFQREG